MLKQNQFLVNSNFGKCLEITSQHQTSHSQPAKEGLNCIETSIRLIELTDFSPVLVGRDDMLLLQLFMSSISSLMGVKRSGNDSIRPLEASWVCRTWSFSSELMDETSTWDSSTWDSSTSVTSDFGSEVSLGPRPRKESFMVSEIWEIQIENADGESAIVGDVGWLNIHNLKIRCNSKIQYRSLTRYLQNDLQKE